MREGWGRRNGDIALVECYRWILKSIILPFGDSGGGVLVDDAEEVTSF